MEYLIGLALAAAVLAACAAIGFDRDRAFYPLMLIVVAHYYVLFAAMSASGAILAAEILVASVFCLFAVLGFRQNLWFTAWALVGHGVMDLFHQSVVANPGVPVWWPGFCLAFDVAAGGWLAICVLHRARNPRRNQKDV